MVKIPERKFGARVTRKQQLQVIAQRKQQQTKRKESRRAIEQSKKVTPKQPTTFLVSGRRFTEGEIQQAESLIFRGKTFAARGDPKLQDLIRRLQSGGQRSRGEIKAQEKIKRQIQIEEQKTEVRRSDSTGEINLVNLGSP